MTETLSYFALLGVGEDVNQEELEARYQELADHLASPAIPAHLQEWARSQAVLVDEAYAVLSDPERRAAVRREREAADHRDDAREPTQPDAELQKEPPETTEPGAGIGRASPQTEPPRPSVFDGLLRLRSRPVLAGVLIGLLALGALLLGRYGLPSGASQEADLEPEQVGALVPLDTERVADLMEAAQQNPSDPDVLFELGETFFQANEWQSAIDWFTKLIAVDPDNIHARTDIGTSHFNLGRPQEAEAAWLAVLEIDPDDVQAHYNLGFVYANAEPLNIASARREWQAVVDLDPDSELASVAQAHLDGLQDEGEEEATPSPPEETGGSGGSD